MSRFLAVALCGLTIVAALLLAGREGGRPPRSQASLPEARTAELPASLPPASASPGAPVVPGTGPTTAPCDAVREAIASMDGARIDMSLDQLVAWVDGDLRRALDVVGLLTRETDPCFLDMVADALSQDARLGDRRELVEAFLDMALRDTLKDRRIAALTFLGERPRGEAMEAAFLSMSQRDTDPDVRTAAVCAIRRQVDLVPSDRARLDRTLVRAMDSEESGVRASAVEALSLAEADDGVVSAVEGRLDDAEPSVRVAAAEKLSEANDGHRARALGALERAYVRDADPRVRCAALVALVRAGRAEALPVLRRLSGTDRSFDPAIEHLVASLAAGKTDVEAILDEAISVLDALPVGRTPNHGAVGGSGPR